MTKEKEEISRKRNFRVTKKRKEENGMYNRTHMFD